jgi:hypothetical protein
MLGGTIATMVHIEQRLGISSLHIKRAAILAASVAAGAVCGLLWEQPLIGLFVGAAFAIAGGVTGWGRTPQIA